VLDVDALGVHPANAGGIFDRPLATATSPIPRLMLQMRLRPPRISGPLS
jgi:hypothetical protein